MAKTGRRAFSINRRTRTLLLLGFSVAFLVVISILGVALQQQAMQTDFGRKNISPCLQYPFGTDWMGRDMLLRTICGLSLSIRLGLLTAGVSALIGLALGSAAALMGSRVDAAISWLIDLMMGIPHILLLILISFAAGKGFTGVVIGITLSHWMSLSRVIRGEIMQLRQSGYVQVAGKLGKGRMYIARKHMLPQVLPQFIVGLILLFPHAILHEASITFLGFGLPPEQPAIGIILSEGMRYLATGYWWLAVFPGAMLVLTVVLFDLIGNSLRRLVDPSSAHE